MVKKIVFRPVFGRIAAVLTVLWGLILFLNACQSNPVPETVIVEFEIQLINAQADSYGYGIVGGQGVDGFGSVNEVLRESFSAQVGDEVFAAVYGSQWSSSEPGHEVICRILVHGEEIYIDSDQGTTTEETYAECSGPVYIPPTPEPG